MTDKKRIVVKTLLSAIIPILIGVAVYFYFRPDTYISKFIADKTGLHSTYVPSKDDRLFIKFCRYYLCDIAWAFALPNALFLAFEMNPAKQNSIAVITLVMILLSEGLQVFGIIPGTGDLIDVIIEICAAAAAIILIKKRFLEEKL